MKKCELCSSIARVYCESDQASLCWDCDARVHTANFLVAKHSRILLCNSCQSLTPWTGSGPKLGPTVSVCQKCFHRNNNNNNDGENQDQDLDDHNDDSEEEDDDEDEDEDEDDGGSSDGDNQVVPLSSSTTDQPHPPSVTSSSSSSEDSTSRFHRRSVIGFSPNRTEQNIQSHYCGITRPQEKVERRSWTWR